jgi:Zn-dependent protease
MASNGLMVMADAGIDINLMLMALNLLPILPLDGGRIAVSLLPHSLAVPYSRLESYGFFVVIILLATGILNQLILPIFLAGKQAIYSLVGLA